MPTAQKERMKVIRTRQNYTKKYIFSAQLSISIFTWMQKKGGFKVSHWLYIALGAAAIDSERSKDQKGWHKMQSLVKF